MAFTIPTEPVVPQNRRASTYRNSSIKTFADVANRIKIRIGAPFAPVTVTDEAIANFIDESIEMYSRYAGYDRKYIVFCDSALRNGCEVQLDEIVTSCLCETGLSGNSLSGDVCETTFVSATNVTSSLLGSGSGLINATCNLSGDQEMTLSYNPSNPWTFEVCDATDVKIMPLSAYPDQEECSPILDAWLKIEDGLGEFYPPEWQSKDKCEPLSSWWGVDSNLSAFDPEKASHVIIDNVPACTVGGLNKIDLNTGKAGTFKVQDKKINSCGFIPASIQFVKNYDLPSALSGNFIVNQNSGFKLKLDPNESFVGTSYSIPIEAEFYNSVSSFEYGVSATPYDPYFDYDRQEKRAIAGVFDVAPAGTGGSGSLLFNFDYLIAQQMFGYDGRGGRSNFSRNGYDMVTYDLSLQFIELVRKRFGGGNSVGFDFDPHTQRLIVHRNRGGFNNGGYCGNSCYMVGIYLERSITHMLSEKWVQDYATALTKITAGNILTKFGGTTIGGLQINGNDILTQGVQEKAELEQWLRNTKSEGGIDTPFYVY